MTLLEQVTQIEYTHTVCPENCRRYHADTLTLCAKLKEVVEALEQIAKQGTLGPAQPRIDTTTMQKIPANPYYDQCLRLAKLASDALTPMKER